MQFLGSSLGYGSLEHEKFFRSRQQKKIIITLKKTVAKSVDLRLLCCVLMQSALNSLALASELSKSQG